MKEQLKLSNQLCFPLYAASKSIVGKYTPFLKPYDLTYTQYLVFLVLFENEEISVKELGETLYLDSGTLSPLLKKLENKGYIKRIRKKDDERVLSITLTKKGKEMEEKLSDVPFNVGSCLKLSKEEVKLLYEALYKILDK